MQHRAAAAQAGESGSGSGSLSRLRRPFAPGAERCGRTVSRRSGGTRTACCWAQRTAQCAARRRHLCNGGADMGRGRAAAAVGRQRRLAHRAPASLRAWWVRGRASAHCHSTSALCSLPATRWQPVGREGWCCVLLVVRCALRERAAARSNTGHHSAACSESLGVGRCVAVAVFVACCCRTNTIQPTTSATDLLQCESRRCECGGRNVAGATGRRNRAFASYMLPPACVRGTGGSSDGLKDAGVGWVISYLFTYN